MKLLEFLFLGVACSLVALDVRAAPAFTDIGANLVGVWRSSVAWGDYDNDGDLDLLVTGRDASFTPRTLIYRNDGNGAFVTMPPTLLEPSDAQVLFADYNGDDHLDILVGAWLYRNDWNGTFTHVSDFPGGGSGPSTFADFDNDGDLDVLVVPGLNNALPKVYSNNGGTFVPGFTYPWWLSGQVTSSAADYDNDGKNDFIVTPVCNNICYTRLLRNFGNGAFAEIATSFPVVSWGVAPWGDFDNDGDLDLLLVGSGTGRLYENRGNGVFGDALNLFEGLHRPAAAWGDYDNDGRLDVWVSGSFSNVAPQAKLFRNTIDGFVDSQIALPGLEWGSVAWADFDNDGDLDIACVGMSDGFLPTARIYRNETANKNTAPTAPNGLRSYITNDSARLTWEASTDSNQVGGLSYSVRIGTAPGRSDVAPAMADLSTGWRRVPQRGNAESRLTASFENLASGIRYYWSVQAIDHSFAGSAFAGEESFYIQAPPVLSGISNQVIRYSSSTLPLAFTIADQETPADLLTLTVSSSDTNLVPHSGIVLDGNDTNRTITVTPVPLRLGSVYVTLVATDSGGRSATNGFAVNVTNTAPTIAKPPDSRIKAGDSVPPITFQIGDADSAPGDLDVSVTFSNTNLLQGIDLSGTSSNRFATLNVIPGARGITTVTLVVRDVMGAVATSAFTVEIFGFELVVSGIGGVHLGALDWGDFDNDGDLDVLLCGQTTNGAQVTAILRNHGSGSFSVIGGRILGITSGGLAWGDYDNDGDLDLVYSGAETRIHRNNPDGTFSEATANLQSFASSKVTWVDYDNDGDLDFMVTGTGSGGVALTRVFQNLGSGVFTNAMVNLPGALGAIAWADYDRDGDLDLATTSVGTVFRNDGNGVFVNIQADLQRVNNGSIAWGDYDNDGWPDLLLTGDSFGRYTRLYHNNGNDTFTAVATGIPDTTLGQAAWGDYDNDGALDVLLTGATPVRFAGIYRNNKNGSFSDIHENWPGVNRSAAAWGDVDGDGDLDVLYTGTTNGALSGSVTRLFRNLVQASNTVPTQPSGPNVLADQVLAWDASSDAETTNSNGLTYNLRIGTSLGGTEVMSPHAGSNGTRRLAQFGNAGSARRWRADLPYGTYYWSVQAIDSAFAGSAFSEDVQLVVTNLRPAITLITNLTTLINYATPEISFSVSDYETPAAMLRLTASSSLTNVVPVENIYFGGTGSNRTLTILPGSNATGVVTVLITAADEGGLSRSTSFRLNVTNPPPYISSIPNQSVPLPSPAGPIFFTVGDPDSSPETLTLTANSSNADLIPDENIVFGGTGTNRSITLTPAKTDPDTSVITVMVTDAYGRSVSTTFVLTVELFTSIATDLVQNARGSLAWGDFDNDNDLDLLVSGQHTPTGNYPLVYRNTNGQFDLAWALQGDYVDCAVAWGDYNNDGWLDFANIGRNYGGGVYPNNKDGTFSGWGIGGIVHSGSVAWGDADDDGDLDLLMTGGTGGAANKTAVYINDRGFFGGDAVPADFPSISRGSGTWEDFDNDGDLDIMLTGLPIVIFTGAPIGTNNGITKLFRREGASIFVDSGVSLPGTYFSAVAWVDFNNDGWLDFAISGNTWTNSITKLFRNNSDGTFNEINSGLPGVQMGSLAWGDWDNDGFPDLLLTGTTDGGPNGAITRVYRNNRNGTFDDVQAGLPGVYGGTAQWGDYDNDGDLDIALCGSSVSTFPIRIYRNNCVKSNALPPYPTGLSSTVVSNRYVSLSWNPISATGSTNGLTYNLRVGRTPNGDEIVASHSSSTGQRRIPAAGNCGLATQRFLQMLPGTYYWSVQTVNAGYVGSPFSSVKSFTLPNRGQVTIAIESASREYLVLRVAGEPYQQYEIESSVDLIRWQELTSVRASPAGVVVWTNAVDSTGQQFFRTRIEAQ